MKRFLCGPRSMCGSERAETSSPDVLGALPALPLPPQNMTALKCKSFSSRSMKPSLICVCLVQYIGASEVLGYGKANLIDDKKVTSNLINKHN